MSHDSIAPSELRTLHDNLANRLARLRFTQPLEEQFRQYLQSVQRRTALFTLYVVCAVWLIFIGLDGWRLYSLRDTGHAIDMFWGSFAMRWPVLVLLALTLYSFHGKQHFRLQQDAGVAALLVAISIAVPLSSYTLKNLDMPETSVSMVLLVSVALFPLGVRLHLMAPLAMWVSIAITCSGPLVLHAYEYDARRQHWVLTGVVWVTFVLSLVAAYYREKGLREQFVLRRLLNWEASHDPLTGLANRRKFHEHFETCVRQAQRQGDALYFAILDIDHFKLFNDRYGHNAGDQALQQVARALQAHAQRPLDLAVRLGGEEFGLLTYGLRSEDISAHLQHLQASLADARIAHEASPTTPYLTVSMGAAGVQPHDTPQDAYRRADALLYQAKHQGRNRICVERLERDHTCVTTLLPPLPCSDGGAHPAGNGDPAEAPSPADGLNGSTAALSSSAPPCVPLSANSAATATSALQP